MTDDPLAFPDILAVCDLKATYFQCLDGKHWARMRTIFTDDASFEGFAFRAEEGPDAFIATVALFLEGVHSQHQGYMPRFAAVGPDLVRGVWGMHDYLTWEPDSRDYKAIRTPGMYGLRGYGYYEDEYRRISGGWRIAFSRLVRTRIDPLVGTPPPAPDYDVLLPSPDFLG